MLRIKPCLWHAMCLFCDRALPPEVIVGVNKYRLAKEDPVEVRCTSMNKHHDFGNCFVLAVCRAGLSQTEFY
jgi:hypothetical protein